MNGNENSPVFAKRPKIEEHASGVCAIVPIGQPGYLPLVHGMGILISDTEVVTCAHVVNYALGRVARASKAPRQPVRIVFPLARASLGSIMGKVDPKRWFPPVSRANLPDDLAVIVLDDPAPAEVGRTELAPDWKLENRAMAFGFPSMDIDGELSSHETGEILWGSLSGTLVGGLGQFTSERFPVTTGFSGAGIYARRPGGVVGMIQTANTDPAVTLAQFMPAHVLDPLRSPTSVPSTPPRLAVDAARVDQAIARKAEIEEKLKAIAAGLAKLPAKGTLIAALTPLTRSTSASAQTLRVALGLPATAKDAKSLFKLLDEPSTKLLAQRTNHFLWRLRETLKAINTPWARTGITTVETLERLCTPLLTAVAPKLSGAAKAIRIGNFSHYKEAAPDTELYAAMRSIPSEEGKPKSLHAKESDVSTVFEFLREKVKSVADDVGRAEDSSNLWWALRLGICWPYPGFADLLPATIQRLTDIRAPTADVASHSVVPEIYTALRTASYTLSNIQAILETRPVITDEVRAQLHSLVVRMFDRIINEATSPNLYLASVHHEGLRNFLDYIERERVEVRGEPQAVEGFGRGLDRNAIATLIKQIADAGGDDAVRGVGLPLAMVALRLGGYDNVREARETPVAGQRPMFGHLLAEKDGERLLIHVVVRNRNDRAGKLNTRYILLKEKMAGEVAGTPSPAEKAYGAKPHWLAVRLEGQRMYSAFLGTIKQLLGKNAVAMKDADIVRYLCLAYHRDYAEDLTST